MKKIAKKADLNIEFNFHIINGLSKSKNLIRDNFTVREKFL